MTRGGGGHVDLRPGVMWRLTVAFVLVLTASCNAALAGDAIPPLPRSAAARVDGLPPPSSLLRAPTRPVLRLDATLEAWPGRVHRPGRLFAVRARGVVPMGMDGAGRMELRVFPSGASGDAEAEAAWLRAPPGRLTVDDAPRWTVCLPVSHWRGGARFHAVFPVRADVGTPRMELWLRFGDGDGDDEDGTDPSEEAGAGARFTRVVDIVPDTTRLVWTTESMVPSSPGVRFERLSPGDWPRGAEGYRSVDVVRWGARAPFDDDDIEGWEGLARWGRMGGAVWGGEGPWRTRWTEALARHGIPLPEPRRPDFPPAQDGEGTWNHGTADADVWAFFLRALPPVRRDPRVDADAYRAHGGERFDDAEAGAMEPAPPSPGAGARLGWTAWALILGLAGSRAWSAFIKRRGGTRLSKTTEAIRREVDGGKATPDGSAHDSLSSFAAEGALHNPPPFSTSTTTVEGIRETPFPLPFPPSTMTPGGGCETPLPQREPPFRAETPSGAEEAVDVSPPPSSPTPPPKTVRTTPFPPLYSRSTMTSGGRCETPLPFFSIPTLATEGGCETPLPQREPPFRAETPSGVEEAVDAPPPSLPPTTSPPKMVRETCLAPANADRGRLRENGGLAVVWLLAGAVAAGGWFATIPVPGSGIDAFRREGVDAPSTAMVSASPRAPSPASPSVPPSASVRWVDHGWAATPFRGAESEIDVRDGGRLRPWPFAPARLSLPCAAWNPWRVLVSDARALDGLCVRLDAPAAFAAAWPAGSVPGDAQGEADAHVNEDADTEAATQNAPGAQAVGSVPPIRSPDGDGVFSLPPGMAHRPGDIPVTHAPPARMRMRLYGRTPRRGPGRRDAPVLLAVEDRMLPETTAWEGARRFREPSVSFRLDTRGHLWPGDRIASAPGAPARTPMADATPMDNSLN